MFNRGSYREAARLATLPGNEVLRTPTTWERFSDPILDRADAWKTYAEALLRAHATDVEQALCLRAALERGAIELLLHWFAMRKVRHSRSAARALLERYSSTPASLQSRVSSIGLAVCAAVASRDRLGPLWEEAFFRAAMGQARPALAYVERATDGKDLAALADAAAGAIVSGGGGSDTVGPKKKKTSHSTADASFDLCLFCTGPHQPRCAKAAVGTHRGAAPGGRRSQQPCDTVGT